jgi:sec-independent protein translocase protein TatA
MPNIRGPELLILVLVVVLLFGAKRLPDAARSVGRSLRIFKSETKGLIDGEAAPDAPAPTAAAPAAPVALPTAEQATPPTPGTPGPVPQAEPAAGSSALQPQADAAPPALQPQPPSQA